LLSNISMTTLWFQREEDPRFATVREGPKGAISSGRDVAILKKLGRGFAGKQQLQ